MDNKNEKLNKDIEQALQLIENKYSTNEYRCHINRPKLIYMLKSTEQEIFNNIINTSYEKSKIDGCLHKELSLLQLKSILSGYLQRFISSFKNEGFDIFYSDSINYKYPDDSLDIPYTFFIETQEQIDSIIQLLKNKGKTKIGIFSMAICSQISYEDFKFYTKCNIRIHTISECIGITRKINHYYNSIRPESQKNIKDIADIHRRSKVFIKLLLKNNIKIEYLKLFMPCFLVNDKPVIARGYTIPVHNLDIKQMAKLRFINRGVLKIIISQIDIRPGWVDANWNIFLIFSIWVHILEQKSDILFNKKVDVLSEHTLNITLKPNDNYDRIIINIDKNR